MHRPKRRGHVLFEPSKSNLYTQMRLAPFKTPIDPELRRPMQDYKAPVTSVRPVPRISRINPQAPAKSAIPQQQLDRNREILEAQRSNLERGRNPFTQNAEAGEARAAAGFRNLINLAYNQPQARPLFEGRGAVDQASMRTRRGITLFSDDAQERRAHKRLRSSFTLNMYKER